MGEVNFPKDPTEHLQNEEFLKKLHRILFDVTYFYILDSYIFGKVTLPQLQERIPYS